MAPHIQYFTSDEHVHVYIIQPTIRANSTYMYNIHGHMTTLDRAIRIFGELSVRWRCKPWTGPSVACNGPPFAHDRHRPRRLSFRITHSLTRSAAQARSAESGDGDGL
jgi:hypothetical protein